MAVAALATLAINSACSSTRAVRPIPASLDVAASASLVGNPDTVQVRLRVINARADTQTVKWDDCRQTGPENALRVYRPDTHALAWDWWPASANINCDLVLYYKTLDPGDSVIIWGRVPVADILGDSLPTGTYNLTVTPKYLEPSYPVEIPVGALTLQQ